MNPIPYKAIEAIPEVVEATRESCLDAADAALLVLFLMGLELETSTIWPPILSNGVELWPLPAPWTDDERDKEALLHTLNGSEDDPGYLVHIKRNAHEFNKAIAESAIPLAQKIAALGPNDSAEVWNNCNALALTDATESVYRPLLLSDECKAAFDALPPVDPGWLP